MICIKLNTTEEVAIKALSFLEGQKCRSLGKSDNSVCVVYWSDGTFSGESKHEDESCIVEETLIFNVLEDFIEAVNQN